MMQKLTVTKIDRAKPKRGQTSTYFSDGGGLLLRVKKLKAGGLGKSWVFRWRDKVDLRTYGEGKRQQVLGRLREMGLGTVDRVPLGRARQLAEDARRVVEAGGDPIEAREAERAERIAERAERMATEVKKLTFDEAVSQAHRVRASEFKNAKHAAQWKSSLDTYASPVIGALPIDVVELAHVVKVLQPIWETKTETATRVRQRIETVLEWARVAGYRSGDNPATWATLKHVLPKPSKIRKVSHHAALPWAEVPAFMANLRKRDGTGARALEFAILTGARSGEVRLATWDEIDLDAKVWTVPAERMKAGKEHRVPLSDAALKLLKALPRRKDSPYIFPAVRGGPLSDMSISAVCRRMEVAAVPHGFRSSFKDWARSSTSYADEVSELALAHVNSDATRAAYARDELLPKRQRLMQDWAKFLAKVPATTEKVTPIRR